MNYFEIDTKELLKCGEDILPLIEEFQTLIVEFYERLEKIPNTSEWIGSKESGKETSVHRFLEKSLSEKGQYFTFADDLKMCANQLIEVSKQLESLVNSNY